MTAPTNLRVGFRFSQSQARKSTSLVSDYAQSSGDLLAVLNAHHDGPRGYALRHGAISRRITLMAPLSIVHERVPDAPLTRAESVHQQPPDIV